MEGLVVFLAMKAKTMHIKLGSLLSSRFLRCSALVLVLFLFTTGARCQSQAEKERSKNKPNVIILFADQHNKKVMGFEGHPDVITPNLDRLASEGLVFDRAYCSVGICVPSRSSMMTGLYPRTLGLLSNGGHTSVMDDAVSMATLFQQNGYRSYAFGKRHLRGAIDRGWDVHKSHMHHESPDENYIAWLEEEGYAKAFAEDWAAEFGRGPRGSSAWQTRFPTADLGTRLSKLPEDYTMEAYTTRETIDVIKKHGKSGKPFFCWANFYRPHQPYTPLKKYMGMYDVSTWGQGTQKGSAIKKPASFYEPAENLPPMLQSQRNGGNKVWNMDKAFEDEQLWRNFIGAYYALVTEIDHCVGQILAALVEAGIEEETLVIYTSDHGDFVGNHGMVEKAAAGHNVYEDILNVPLIVKYPGRVKNGRRTAELVSLVDVLPTLVDLLGLKVPELKYPMQGDSLAGLILKDTAMNRPYVVSESWSQATVITQTHKLGIMLDPTAVHKGWDYRDFGDMFFDRVADPLEVQNGINSSAYQPTIAKLQAYYECFKQAVPATGKTELVKQRP
jgi:arylsulfatase